MTESPTRTGGITPDELAARAAIATTLARHSRGVDRNEFDLLASAYHPDAAVAYGMFEGPALDFARMLADAMAGAPVTLHRTSNMLIRVAGDEARSESYVIAYTRTPDDEAATRWTQRLIGGRYLDRHSLRDGEWRIAHRTYVLEWNMNVPSREAVAAMSGTPQGAQRAADQAHALFADFRAGQRKGETMTSASVDEAIAKQALHDLICTYARGVDRADEALLASVFHPDAEVLTGVIDGAGPAYARDIAAMVRGNLKSTFHSMANEYFEVADDRAVGETYVIAHMITAADPAEETITGGRYLDRFERRDGVWKIAHRSFVHDWSMTQPVSMEETGMYESLTLRGGYTPNDPSVAFWRGS
jgi:hypothetical protein